MSAEYRADAPWVIAEMSGNHNNSIDRALTIIDAAAAAGVQAIKFQTYTADTMTIDVRRDEFVITDPKSLWFGRTLYDLYAEAATPWEWHLELFAYARAKGLVPFSTPFDETAVDFLETLGVPIYKIASFENTDHALIRKVAATGKPMIMSTGMASVDELAESVAVARDGGCADLTLLKCTSAYPSPPESVNLLTIPDMRERFGCDVGLSDHTLGIGVAIAGVALGATVIEKHFTLDRTQGGIDSAFSMEPAEMAQLVIESNRAWLALGEVGYGCSTADQSMITFRRSLYVVTDVKAGDEFTRESVRAIRPGLGLAPKHLDEAIGRVAACDIAQGTPLAWNFIT
jgi:N-acetylneuraminate synthase